MIVNESGQPFAEVPDSCPSCGSLSRDHHTAQSFGGHWQTVCISCGHVIAKGKNS